MSNNKKAKIRVLIFLCLFVFLISAVFFRHKAEEKIVSAGTNNIESVTIMGGGVTAHLQIAPDTLLYDALVQAKNAKIITFNGKNYPGLGFFMTDIGTLHRGGGKDLLYYINGKEATIGVSSYKLNDGDNILWKLE